MLRLGASDRVAIHGFETSARALGYHRWAVQEGRTKMTRKRLASLVAATTLAVLASSCEKGDKSGSTQTSAANVPTTPTTPTTNVLTEPKVQPVVA
jgi:hypothetical protein